MRAHQDPAPLKAAAQLFGRRALEGRVAASTLADLEPAARAWLEACGCLSTTKAIASGVDAGVVVAECARGGCFMDVEDDPLRAICPDGLCGSVPIDDRALVAQVRADPRPLFDGIARASGLKGAVQRSGRGVWSLGEVTYLDRDVPIFWVTGSRPRALERVRAPRHVRAAVLLWAGDMPTSNERERLAGQGLHVLSPTDALTATLALDHELVMRGAVPEAWEARLDDPSYEHPALDLHFDLDDSGHIRAWWAGQQVFDQMPTSPDRWLFLLARLAAGAVSGRPWVARTRFGLRDDELARLREYLEDESDERGYPELTGARILRSGRRSRRRGQFRLAARAERVRFAVDWRCVRLRSDERGHPERAPTPGQTLRMASLDEQDALHRELIAELATLVPHRP